MFDIGRVCTKIAGRDAGKKCVVIDNISDSVVMIDGQTRRRKCNVSHLEPSEDVAKVKKNASNKEVCDALKKLKIECKEKTAKTAEPKKAKK